MMLRRPCVLILSSFILYSTAFSQPSSVAQSTFKDFGMYSPHSLLNGTTLNAFNNVENTKGRRYFFDHWVRGSVVSVFGKAISGNGYYFNFDKISNGLLVTQDKKEVIEVDKESIKSFSLTENGADYNFGKVDQIDPFRFLQVLVKGDSLHYSLYKSFNTRFVKSDYTTDGLTESGKPYDEYVDAPLYYVVHRGEMKPVVLKFKSIKAALKDDSKKVNDYYGDHVSEEVDERYLKNLIFYLNQ